MALGKDSPARVEREAGDEGRTILDSLPVLVSRIDADGRYRFANRGYETWFGLRPDEVVGRTVSEVLGEAAYACVRPYVERVQAGEPVTYEQNVPYRTGGRDVRATYTPVRGADGTGDGFVALVMDVSAGRPTEDALQVSEERLRSILDNTPSIVFVKDVDRSVSAAWEEAGGVATQTATTWMLNDTVSLLTALRDETRRHADALSALAPAGAGAGR